MRNLKVFGIKSIPVNGTVVNTFNVSIKPNVRFKELAVKNGITVIEKTRQFKNKGIVRLDEYTFTSLDNKLFNDKVDILGNILYNNAKQRFDEKHCWHNKSVIY